MYRSIFCFLVFLGPIVWMAFPGNALSEVTEEHTAIYILGEMAVTAERDVVESIGTVCEITAKHIQAFIRERR